MGTPTMTRPGSAWDGGSAPDSSGYRAVAVARWRIVALRVATTALWLVFLFELVASIALAQNVHDRSHPPARAVFAWASWLFHYDAAGVGYTYPPLLLWLALFVGFVVATPLLVPRNIAVARAGGGARFVWSARAERARMAASLRELGCAKTLLRVAHHRRTRVIVAEAAVLVATALAAYTVIAKVAMFQTGRFTRSGYLTAGLGPKLCLAAAVLAAAALPLAWPFGDERHVLILPDGTVQPDPPAALPAASEPPPAPEAGFVAPYLSGPPAKPRRPRRRILIGVAVLALAAGVVVWAPWAKTGPSVPKPGPLVAGRTTPSSAALRWTPPSTGSAPDRYVITRDGSEVGSVPGSVTSYTDKRAAPATTYRYRVVAVRGGHRSAPSGPLALTTGTPPVASARLQGEFRARSKVTSSGGGNVTVGTAMNDTWRFTPKCRSGPCSVVLSGQLGGGQFTPHAFRMTLTRSGGRYSGTATAHITHCGATRVSDRLTLRLRVTKAATEGLTWTVRAFTATLIEASPYTSSGAGRYCPAQSHTMTVTGSQ